MSLNRAAAAAVRGLDLPSVYISGYGAKWRYPARLVRKAAKILGVSQHMLGGPG
jgi:hypothetical protein